MNPHEVFGTGVEYGAQVCVKRWYLMLNEKQEVDITYFFPVAAAANLIYNICCVEAQGYQFPT